MPSAVFSAIGAAANSSVYPSGAAFATASMPIVPPAPPGRFSMMNCWPSRSDMRCASIRATLSSAPPATVGTITRTGRAGYAPASCACAGSAPLAAHARPAPSSLRRVSRPGSREVAHSAPAGSTAAAVTVVSASDGMWRTGRKVILGLLGEGRRRCAASVGSVRGQGPAAVRVAGDLRIRMRWRPEHRARPAPRAPCRNTGRRRAARTATTAPGRGGRARRRVPRRRRTAPSSVPSA